MGVRGTRSSVKTHHPKELINALYDEVFSLHPDEAEVDVALSVRRRKDDDFVEVIDYKLFRVSDPDVSGRFRFIATDDDSYPESMLKGIIDWGVEQEQANPVSDPETEHIGLLWLHKHPEGMAYASEKDELFHEVLVDMDYVRNKPTRLYMGGAVVTRHASEPLHSSEIMPAPNTPIKWLNYAIVEASTQRVIDKEGMGPEHPYVQALERLKAQHRILLSAREGSAEFTAAQEEATRIVQELMRLTPIPDGIPDVIKDLLNKLISGVAGDGESQPIGFQPPAPKPEPEPLRLPIQKYLSLEELMGLPASDNIQLPEENN